jgi:hypothetical protein
MSQVTERTTTRNTVRPLPDEAPLTQSGPGSRSDAILRTLGALSVLTVGAVHLEQYFAVHFNVVPVIGPLFALNFVGATLIGVGLLFPLERMQARSARLLGTLLALGGIGLAVTAFVFLLVSEHMPLFGFQDYGYRTAIVTALAAEAAAVVFLGAYLGARMRQR